MPGYVHGLGRDFDNFIRDYVYRAASFLTRILSSISLCSGHTRHVRYIVHAKAKAHGELMQTNNIPSPYCQHLISPLSLTRIRRRKIK